MNISTTELPEGYIHYSEIKFAENKHQLILLFTFGVFIVMLSFFLLSVFTASFRPEITNLSGTLNLGLLAALIGLYALSIIIHELIHGQFFWLFTRSKPVFNLRLPFYISVSTPDWFIPARPYAIIGLSPLIIIGIVGLLLLLVIPAGWIMYIIFLSP